MTNTSYIDGVIEVHTDGWPHQHDPGLHLSPYISLTHLGPTIHNTQLYRFRTTSEYMPEIEQCVGIVSKFVGAPADLFASNYERKLDAFYVDANRRNASGGATQVSIPVTGLQCGDEIVSALSPRIWWAGEQAEMPALTLDEILSLANISPLSGVAATHPFDAVAYFVISGFNPFPSQAENVELSPGMFWIPACNLPRDVFVDLNQEYSVPLSGAFAFNAANMVEGYSVELSREYKAAKSAVFDLLAVVTLVSDLTPIIAFTWASYVQPATGQRVTSSGTMLQVFDTRVYGEKRYATQRATLEKSVVNSLLPVLTFDRAPRTRRQITGFLRALADAHRTIHPSTGFPIIWSALESLLNPGSSEISFKVAVAISSFYDVSDREQIYTEVKKGYSLRSNIVHGNKYDDIDIDEYGPKALNYCRLILKRALEGSLSDESLTNLSADVRFKRVLLGEAP